MGRGNIIGKRNLPATTAAGGVWGLREQYAANRADEWPGYDPQWSKTTLLLKTGTATADAFLDSSANNFTVTRFGDTIQTTATPYAPHWSNQFDGAGDYLTVPSNAAFAIGTANFTLEFWINPANWSKTDNVVCTAVGSGGLMMIGRAAGNFGIRAYGVADQLTYSGLPTTGAWSHIVAVRNGTTMSLFVNGTRVATTTNSYSFSQGAFAIGNDGGAGADYTGHISNLRLVKGTAVYDPSLTTLAVPTAPLTAIANTSLLACQDNRFKDNSTNNFSLSRFGDAAVSRFSPFAWGWTAASGGSGYFDGTGDYLGLPVSSAWTMGTGDFTVECWVYVTGPSSESNGVFQISDSAYFNGTNGFALQAYSNNNNVNTWYIYSGNGAVTQGPAWTYNTWYHCAMVRQSGTTRLYINGQSVVSVADTTNYTGTYLGIGSIYSNTDSYRMRGHISNFRVLKGTAAYTASFTAPTSPVTAIANTSLLLNFTNAAYRDTSGIASVMRPFGTLSRGTLAPSAELTSIGFNGSTDYLGWVGNNVMNFGSGNFTAQAWVRLNAMPTSDAWPSSYSSHMVVVECGTFNVGDGCAFIIGATKLIFHSNDTPYLSANHNMVINTWYHVAVRRSGNMLAFFVNGTPIGTANFTGSVGVAGSTFVGCETGQGAFLNGMLSNLKVDKSIALRGSHGSVYFDGAGGDFLSVPNAAANITNQNYTAEAWVRFTTNSIGYQPIFGNTGTGDAHGWILITETNNYLYAYHSASGGAWNYNIGTSYQPTVNVWTHLALVRNGTTVTLYANGTSIGSTTIGTNSVQSPSGAFYAGYYPWFPGGARSLTGNISNLRLVIGTAVYTSNFTPPTEPLTAITNTTLLTAQSTDTITDISAAARTITRGGDASAVDLSPFNPIQMFTPSTAPLTPDPTTTLLLSATADFYDATNKHNISSTATVVNTPVKINGSAASFTGSQVARLWPSASTTANFAFGTGDFTIEAWIYPTSISGDRNIFCTRGAANSAVYFGLYTGAYTLGFWTAGGWQLISTRPVTPNTWSHVVLQRANGVAYFFIDGVPAGSVANTTNLSGSTAAVGFSVGDNAYGWVGQMDEVRVTKGVARYSGTFTPPAIGYSRDWEPNYNDDLTPANTLMVKTIDVAGATNSVFRDDSTNSFTVTRFGDTTQGTFTPFYPTGYWSAYFDGSGDYLTTASSTGLQFATSDFTVECWVNKAVTGTQNLLVWGAGGGGGANDLVIYTAGNNELVLYANTTARITGPSLQNNRWHHIAAVRQSGTTRLYLDGSLVGSWVDGTNYTATTVTVGWSGSTWNGHISNLRVVKGTAVYTSNFTPPTSPLTAITNTTLLCLQDNRFIDRSINNLAITRFGDVAVSRFDPFPLPVPVTTTATINPGSVSFDGAGDYMTAPYLTTNFDWWSSDHTIEAWVYAASWSTWSYVDGGNMPIMVGNNAFNSTNNYWTFGPTTDGKVVFYYWNGGYNRLSSTATVVANQWNHVAMTKTSAGVTLYVNGVASATTAVVGTPQSSNGQGLTVGAGNNTYLTGNVSNLRIIKGTAVYSGNFSPPTAPLTPVTNTKLLTAQDPVTVTDASTNALTITRLGDAKASSLNPFQLASTKLATYTYGGSGYFDGAGDYLSIANSASLNMGTGDFCIEFWWNFSAGSYKTPFDKGYNVAGSLVFQTNNTTANVIDIYSGGVKLLSANAALPVGAWSHIALVRNGTTLTLYQNGVSVASATNSTNFTCANNLLIGVDGSLSAVTHFTGHLSSLRVVKGSAVYTTAFTPPTGPLTAISNTSLLLAFDNAGVYDATGQTNLAITGTTASSSVQTQYGAASILFPGSGGGDVRLSGNPTIFNFGTGDFTFECWARPTTLTGCFVRPDFGGGSFEFGILDASTLYVDAAGSQRILTVTASMSANTWQHFAICRGAGVMRAFVNGVQQGASVSTTFSFASATGVIRLGGSGYSTSAYINGYMQDIRVTKTARYVTNFIPPTASLPLS